MQVSSNVVIREEQQRRPVNTNATRMQCNAVAESASSLPNELSTSLTVNIMNVQKEEEGEDYLSTQKTSRHEACGQYLSP